MRLGNTRGKYLKNKKIVLEAENCVCFSRETVTTMMVGNSNIALETELQNLPLKTLRYRLQRNIG